MRKIILFLILNLVASMALAKVHSGNYNMTFDLSAHNRNGEARLWIPYPVSDGNQVISNISWSGNYSEAAVYTDQEFGTPMLYVRWDKSSEKKHMTFNFSAKRNEQVAKDIPGSAALFNPNDYRLYLAATSLGPTDGGVKVLADKITGSESTILGKARAIYDWTVDNTFRDPKTRGCGVGDVNKLLKRPGGKCADISSVYVALARAAGVPSREVFGIRSGRDDRQDVTGWQHCWAEFYLPGYGWVPVDPADVRKAMLRQKLKIDDPRVAELREYFFGSVDPYRVRLAEGRDLQLNPPHDGPPLNYLMYPFAQVGGETIDWLDPKSFSYKIIWQPDTQ